MQHKQASWRWPTDSDWGRTLAKAIALKLKLNLLSNFYSILDDSAPPTCPINEQDKNNNKQVHYNNKIKEEVLTDPSPPPLQTAVQHQTLEQQKTEQRKHSLQQNTSQTKHSACPMARWRGQATWTNSTTMCSILQRTCTSCQELSVALSSASPKSWHKLHCDVWQGQSQYLRCQ